MVWSTKLSYELSWNEKCFFHLLRVTSAQQIKLNYSPKTIPAFIAFEIVVCCFVFFRGGYLLVNFKM